MGSGGRRTWREFCARSPAPATTGIECGDLAAYYPVEQISQLLAETGLQLVGVHAGFNNVADPRKLNASPIW